MKSAKFKDSPLGPIPEDWEVKRLGDLCEKIGSGATPLGGASSYCKTGIALIRSQNVVDTCFSFDGLAYINSAQAEELANVEVLSKDVLLNITGDSVARVCTVPDSVLPARVNQHVCILRTIAEKCHYLYLAYRLVVEKKRLLAAAFGGGTRNALTKADVEAFTIPCPPLPEQQRIAEALCEVDKLIESLDEQIEKKRLIAKGVAHDLLSAKKRLPGFEPAGGRMQDRGYDSSLPEGWAMKRLGDCVEINPIGGQIPDEFVYVDLESVKNGCLVQNNVVLRRDAPSRAQRQFAFGDVLFQTVRPYQKNNLFVNFNASKYVASTGYAVLRERDGVSAALYIYAYLHLDSFVAQVLDKCTGTSYPAINPTALAGIEIALPELAEQQAIADLLSEQDAAIAALEAKREKYARIKEGMMRDLLTGKVRI